MFPFYFNRVQTFGVRTEKQILKYKYSFTNTALTAIKRFLKPTSIPEIKDMYDQHPSITVISKRLVSIDFYRLIDTIDNVYMIDIDSYQFIERFPVIDFHRLPKPGLKKINFYPAVRTWSVIACFSFSWSHAPDLQFSLVQTNTRRVFRYTG